MQKRYLTLFLISIFAFQLLIYFGAVLGSNGFINLIIITTLVPLLVSIAPSFFLIIKHSAQNSSSRKNEIYHFLPSLLIFIINFFSLLLFKQIGTELVKTIISSTVVLMAFIFSIQSLIYIVLSYKEIKNYKQVQKEGKLKNINTAWMKRLLIIYISFIICTIIVETPLIEGSHLPSSLINASLIISILLCLNDKNLN